MPGHEARWGWEELADPWGAGQAGLEPQIILEIASCSVCNQDQTGSGAGGGGSHCRFLSSQPRACLVFWLSGMTFAGARRWKRPTVSSSP